MTSMYRSKITFLMMLWGKWDTSATYEYNVWVCLLFTAGFRQVSSNARHAF